MGGVGEAVTCESAAELFDDTGLAIFFGVAIFDFVDKFSE